MDVGKLGSGSVQTAETIETMAVSVASTAAAGSGDGKVALVAGATGLVGRELVRALLLLPSSAWKLVYGVARRPPDDDGDVDDDDERYRFVACDLLDWMETREKLGPLAEQVTHVFWVTWASQFPLDTQECCDQNRAMLSNALDALLPPVPRPALAHLALQTGTKHYVSLKQSAGGGRRVYYYEEESPRVDEGVHNFYYALEDLVKDRLGGGSGGRRIASWSVHRPGLLLGSSGRSHFNLMGCLCVYASICRHLGLPFLFHGLRRCWEEPYMDASDARLVAQQHLWWASAVSSSSSAAEDCQAFNAVNGTAFTWKEIWPALAAKFGLSLQGHASRGGDNDGSGELVSEKTSYSGLMADKEAAWEEIVAKESLRPTRMDDLANWAFLDTVLRFPFKMLVNSDKARRLGFTTTYAALESLLHWVDRMREERLIPY